MDKKADRLQHIAEMLNAVGRDTEISILSNIEEANPNLAQKIRDRMFTFNDLTKVDKKQMQFVLKEVDPEVLVLALKTASDAVKELIFKSMSSRAVEIVKDDLENLGPRKREDIDAAQMKLMQLVRKLIDEGKIVLLGNDTV